MCALTGATSHIVCDVVLNTRTGTVTFKKLNVELIFRQNQEQNSLDCDGRPEY